MSLMSDHWWMSGTDPAMLMELRERIVSHNETAAKRWAARKPELRWVGTLHEWERLIFDRNGPRVEKYHREPRRNGGDW